MMRPVYPSTRSESSVDSVVGLEFPDPYRWLEAETDEVKQWQLAQSQFADHYVLAWPYFKSLQKSVEHFLVNGYCAYPQFAGGKWFRAGYEKSTGRSGVVVSESPYGEGQLVYALNGENPETPAFMVSISPSPNGDLLAIGVCTDGSEYNTIRLVKVDTGELLPHAPHQLLLG